MDDEQKPQGEVEGKRVLIVEDDSFLHNLLADNLKTLHDKGVEVVPTFNGQEALEKAREQKPDLVLLDIVLPGMNGFEILEEIRKDSNLKDTPVIILSNLGQQKDIDRGKELGVVDYLIKANFTLEELTSTILSVLKK